MRKTKVEKQVNAMCYAKCDDVIKTSNRVVRAMASARFHCLKLNCKNFQANFSQIIKENSSFSF